MSDSVVEICKDRNVSRETKEGRKKQFPHFNFNLNVDILGGS